MQSDLVVTSMDARLFVVYETHLLHANEFGMVLYMDVFLDVHGDVFTTTYLLFFNNKPTFSEAALRFAFFLEAACFSSTSLWTR